jgi:single-strand DNA-binding protein
MDDLNQVAIAGRLTRDPQLRTTRNGTQICNLRIACNKMFFNVKIWGEPGQQLAANASKGDIVQVEGRLDWNEWSPGDGPRREFVGVVANDAPGAVRCIASSGGPPVAMGQQFAPQNALAAGAITPPGMPSAFATQSMGGDFSLSAQPQANFAAVQPLAAAPPAAAIPPLGAPGFPPAASAEPRPQAPAPPAMAPSSPQAPPAIMQQGFPPNAPLMAPNPGAQDLSQGIGAGDAPAVAAVQPGGFGEPEPSLGGQYPAPVPVGVGAESTGAIEEDSRFM